MLFVELIEKWFPPKGSETIAFTCGRPEMNNDCRAHLTDLGHVSNRIYQF